MIERLSPLLCSTLSGLFFAVDVSAVHSHIPDLSLALMSMDATEQQLIPIEHKKLFFPSSLTADFQTLDQETVT